MISVTSNVMTSKSYDAPYLKAQVNHGKENTNLSPLPLLDVHYHSLECFCIPTIIAIT